MSSLIDFLRDREEDRRGRFSWKEGDRHLCQKVVHLNISSQEHARDLLSSDASSERPLSDDPPTSQPAIRAPLFNARSAPWHPALIQRFDHAQNLVGHRGCVNRIQWNSDASILASGSDDLQILFWRYNQNIFSDTPSSLNSVFSPLGRLKTGHSRNIFGVQFLTPTQIVTGAMDGEVRYHQLSEAPTDPVSAPTPFTTPTVSATTTTFKCHRRHRVKDVEIDPISSPFLYWSASEDQTIRQFDSRQPHPPCANGSCRNAIISSPAEFKSVSISRARPNYLCAAASDSIVRVYDRRMLTPRSRGDFEGDLDSLCLYRFSPYEYVPSGTRVFTTHCSFSRDGRSVMANYNGDHLYEFSFDTDLVTTFSPPAPSSSSSSSSSSTSIPLNNPIPFTSTSFTSASPPLSHQNCRPCALAFREKAKGNQLFQKGQLSEAISCYSNGIETTLSCNADPSSVIPLLANRAGVYLRRKWRGDAECALRDCDRVLCFDDRHSKALYRKATALKLLREYPLALKVARTGQLLHPDQQDFPKLISKLESLMASSNNTPLSPQTPSTSSEDISDDQPLSGSSHESEVDSSTSTLPHRPVALSHVWRRRFCGHQNSSTDIKEVFLFGDQDQYVMTGSDDGHLYIWDRISTALLLTLPADESVCNSLKAHPFDPVIVTSGIESVIKVWTPSSHRQENPYCDSSRRQMIENNQHSLNTPEPTVSFSELLTMFPNVAPGNCHPQ